MMQAVHYSVGEADNMYLSEVPIPEPGDGEVRIQIFATAINRADTLQRKGSYNPPAGASTILGLEAAGVIDKVGTGCPDTIYKGLKVMALLTGGGNAEYVTCRHEFLMPIPENLDFVRAAAIPEVWLTAYQLLFTIGKVSINDVVLIHAGGSGVGTAAIQLVKQLGATAIVTAGSDRKIEFVKCLGADVAINYKIENISEKVLLHTNNKGVSLILDCVGSSMFEDNLRSICLDGRWIVYGCLGGSQINTDLSRLLAKRISMTFTTLRFRSTEYKESLIQEFTKHAVPLFEKGTFQPVIEKVFPLSKIALAHKLMESNENLGKLVLQVKKE